MRRGRRLTSGSLRFVYTPNGEGHARLGLAVSRRYGNAVRRNRLKRQLRACFRQSHAREVAVDILIAPVADWKRMEDIHTDMSGGLERIMQRLQREAL